MEDFLEIEIKFIEDALSFVYNDIIKRTEKA